MSNELIKRGHRVRGIQQLEPIYSEWKDTIKEFNVLDDVDTLVFAVGYNPVALPIENAHLIGDCQKVGTLKDAITNAYQITKEI